MVTTRYSKENDLDSIKKLIESRFGVRETAYTDLNDRYLLLFDDEKLIGMTGCNLSPLYNGYEIDWTCIQKEYEGHGYMSKLMEQAIKNYLKYDIYCSCLHMSNKKEINLKHIMDKLNFQCCIEKRIQFNSKYINCKNICIIDKNENCNCWEDLYVRKANT